MRQRDRDRFDELLEGVLDALPERLRGLLDEVPVIVLDRPTREMLHELGIPREEHEAAAKELCGLHTGTPRTERSLEESGALPDEIHLFREGIIALAGGWGTEGASRRVAEEIRVTLLHEIGHHFGLDEDDLEGLGYA